MKQTVRDIDVASKRVLVRVDYNVPIKDGVVGDTLRIQASFDTINYLLKQHCRIVLISHLGRPDGKPDPKFSLKPVAAKAAELLDRPIKFANDCVGDLIQKAANDLQPGEILLLENLRFHAEEEANDPEFAKQLAALGDVFVQDGFAAIHREHASTTGIPKHLPSVSGLLVDKEVATITGALENPKKPLLAISGGAKISDKIEVLSNLLKKVDVLAIGGAMANTFLAAQDVEVGKSLYEPDQTDTAKEILDQAKSLGVEVILPTDAVVSESAEKPVNQRTVSTSAVKPADLIVDLGPQTIQKIIAAIRRAGTVIWNGPVGVTEVKAFADGSIVLAEALADSNAASVIGGGDTAAFVNAAGLHKEFDWVSTGGGAGLDLMAGKKLPGYEALLDK